MIEEYFEPEADDKPNIAKLSGRLSRARSDGHGSTHTNRQGSDHPLGRTIGADFGPVQRLLEQLPIFAFDQALLLILLILLIGASVQVLD